MEKAATALTVRLGNTRTQTWQDNYGLSSTSLSWSDVTL